MVGPKNTKYPGMGLRIGLRVWFLVQPALFFEPEPFPRFPGPAVGPKGPNIGQKPGAGFIILSLRSAQPTDERYLLITITMPVLG